MGWWHTRSAMSRTSAECSVAEKSSTCARGRAQARQQRRPPACTLTAAACPRPTRTCAGPLWLRWRAKPAPNYWQHAGSTARAAALRAPAGASRGARLQACDACARLGELPEQLQDQLAVAGVQQAVCLHARGAAEAASAAPAAARASGAASALGAGAPTRARSQQGWTCATRRGGAAGGRGAAARRRAPRPAQSGARRAAPACRCAPAPPRALPRSRPAACARARQGLCCLARRRAAAP